jgi:ribosome-binding ATPase YchF (GTP1/OBG family)
MKAGLIGFPGSGRETVFRALTGLPALKAPSEQRQGEAPVPDERLDYLSGLFQPRKHTPAKLELFLPKPHGATPGEAMRLSLEKLRDSDVLLAVARNFPGQGLPLPDPAKEAAAIQSELLVTDYLTVEKRLERLAEDRKRGKKGDPAEEELLELARLSLESNRPLREVEAVRLAPCLKGFGFLSAKPCLALINQPDDGDGGAADGPIGPGRELSIKGRLEEEISQLEAAEAREFLRDYGLDEPVAARVSRTLYQLMDLISFFTVGEDECRAWTVGRGEEALSAAGRIHSDIRKGFIRAEVVSFQDFKACGGMAEAKRKGLFRLEGKTYPVADGDIIHFRFNL